MVGTILYEDFEGTFPPAGWYIVDGGSATGDGWFRSNDRSRSGNYSAAVLYQPSTNVKSEWLITPALDFSGDSAIFLKFYEDGDFWDGYGEHHKILVSTTSQTDTTTFTTVLDMTPTNHDIAGFDGEPVVVDLSAYAGQPTVYIAIKYEGQDADDWYIDDLEIFAPADSDARPVEVVNVFPGGGSFSPVAVIENNGNLPLSNVPVRLLLIHGQDTVYDEVAIYSGTMASMGDTGIVVFPQFDGVDGFLYSYTLITQLPGEQNPVNDTARGYIYAYTGVFKPLWERFTNVGCSPCRPADLVQDSLYHVYGYDYAMVVYHMSWPSSSDPFYLYNTTQNNARRSYYNVNYVPRLVLDGTVDGEYNYPIWPNLLAQEMERKQPILFLVSNAPESTFVASSGDGRISFYAHQTGEMPGDTYTLRVAIVEDSIHYNAPNGTTFHPMTFRHMLEDTYVSSTGGYVTYSFDFTFNPTYVDYTKLVAVIWIQDDATRQVWATEVYPFENEVLDVVEGPTGDAFSVLPEGIRFSRSIEGPVRVELYSPAGRKVISLEKRVGAGQMITFDKVTEGIYIYRISMEGRVWTGKVFIR